MRWDTFTIGAGPVSFGRPFSHTWHGMSCRKTVTEDTAGNSGRHDPHSLTERQLHTLTEKSADRDRQWSEGSGPPSTHPFKAQLKRCPTESPFQA